MSNKRMSPEMRLAGVKEQLAMAKKLGFNSLIDSLLRDIKVIEDEIISSQPKNNPLHKK